jgi:hypothetical protein
MITPYAETYDLAEYLGLTEAELPTDAERQLQRASELIRHYTLGRVAVTNAAHVDAVKQATCAQVESWISDGEDSDTGRALKSYSIGRVSVAYADSGGNQGSGAVSRLAPRARQELLQAGLLYCGGSTSRGISALID